MANYGTYNLGLTRSDVASEPSEQCLNAEIAMIERGMETFFKLFHSSLPGERKDTIWRVISLCQERVDQLRATIYKSDCKILHAMSSAFVTVFAGRPQFQGSDGVQWAHWFSPSRPCISHLDPLS